MANAEQYELGIGQLWKSGKDAEDIRIIADIRLSFTGARIAWMHPGRPGHFKTAELRSFRQWIKHSDAEHYAGGSGSLRDCITDLLNALGDLIHNARPINWDDDDDPRQSAAWREAERAISRVIRVPEPVDG